MSHFCESVCVCVRARARACVRACVYVTTYGLLYALVYTYTLQNHEQTTNNCLHGHKHGCTKYNREKALIHISNMHKATLK